MAAASQRLPSPRRGRKGAASEGFPLDLTPEQAEHIRVLAYADVWAEKLTLMVDGHRFDPRGREYEHAIMRDEHHWIVVPKGAQLGLTTVFVIRTCHWVTQRGWNHLYLLPLKTGSITFVQGRIDPIIDSNPALAKLFNRTDNRSHKQSQGGTNWYIRGTNIETELREVPVDVLVVDERDKANEENLAEHAYERLAGSKVARVVELSTPTVAGHGVYGEDAWEASDQMEWWVACPHCNAKQVYSFEENLLPWMGERADESQLCCSHCKRQITDAQRGEQNAGGLWVAANPGAEKRGYRITQLNSPTKPISSLAGNWFKGRRDSKAMAAFYRNGLALPYTAVGDKFSMQLLDNSILRDHVLGGIPNGPVFIGVDVQYEALYCTCYTRNRQGALALWDARVITAQPARSKWQVLEETYFQRLFNWRCLIDAHPAKEEVETLTKKWHGKVWMAFEKDMPSQPTTANWHPYKYGEVARVTIDRTMAFDGYIKMFLDGLMHLPVDARQIGEVLPRLPYNGFYHQHMQMTRVEQPNAQDVIVARWVNGYQAADAKTNSRKSGSTGKRPDHWHHSGMFAFVCSEQDVPLAVPAEVGNIIAGAGGFIR